MKRKLDPAAEVAGQLYLKRDDILPVSRFNQSQGRHLEILKLAESIALKHGLITLADDYSVLSHRKIKIFSQYAVAVGSTGNLGLSVGIISAKLGFQTEVHSRPMPGSGRKTNCAL